ncbi:TIGR03089 family protein [Cellulosimicrobium sp. NPDC057127]|uniref:TIGR03089 family protein n=1 Tax=Cellulosimicrobium sp. NPDC057127 TaxID=3346026 RepID=UPI0036459494
MSNSQDAKNSHGNPSTPVVTDVEGLLRLVTRDPGRPRLTWYGDDGERVELSGAVLENWVNKVTNLLVEEFDTGPGTHVTLDLPPHWRTVVWALAVWRTGATAILISTDAADGADIVKEHGTGKADVVVTARPASWSGAASEIVAVALPALARRFDGELPPGAVDAASGVMTYGDQLSWAPTPEPGVAAVQGDRADGALLHGDLVRTAYLDTAALAGARALVRGTASSAEVLLTVLGVLAADGSVVLLSARRTAELDADDTALRRITETERVTDALR